MHISIFWHVIDWWLLNIFFIFVRQPHVIKISVMFCFRWAGNFSILVITVVISFTLLVSPDSKQDPSFDCLTFGSDKWRTHFDMFNRLQTHPVIHDFKFALNTFKCLLKLILPCKLIIPLIGIILHLWPEGICV